MATNTLWSAGLVAFGSLLMHIWQGDPEQVPNVQRDVNLETLLNSLPEAVLLFNQNTKVMGFNRTAEQLIGLSRRKLLGTGVRGLSYHVVDPSANNPNELPVMRALEGEFVRHERGVFIPGRGGAAMEVLVSASPIEVAASRIIGVMVVIQDVTELSALQRQMASSERHFAVGQMTAGLAHDFNNVLNTISQAVYMMDAEEGRSDHDHVMLRVIQNAVRRGGEVVGNIRGYLRGNREERTSVNMRQLMEDVLELAQPLLDVHRNIQVATELQDSCEVYANAPELRRVFTNLILNAVDAMPEGGNLEISCTRNAGQVTTTISDTGSGIPREKQQLIFAPYFTTKPTGTGLGLAGARRTVQAQGGDIRFESTPGKGTCFYVTLPVANGGEQLNLRAA